LAIFEATERLLADVPLHELSVAQIINAAEISRATFYFYFSSKYAVVTGLLANVMDDIYESVSPFVNRSEDVDPRDALAQSLEASAAIWRAHRASLRAVVEHWHAVPELKTLWLGVVTRFSEAVAVEIDRQRAAGLAPEGPDSRKLGSALIWGTERCLYVAGLGVDEQLPDEVASLDAVLPLWIGTIYGSPKAAPAKRAGKASTRPARPAGSASKQSRSNSSQRNRKP
jgi:AcrR family transcriptional regulator